MLRLPSCKPRTHPSSDLQSVSDHLRNRSRHQPHTRGSSWPSNDFGQRYALELTDGCRRERRRHANGSDSVATATGGTPVVPVGGRVAGGMSVDSVWTHGNASLPEGARRSLSSVYSCHLASQGPLSERGKRKMAHSFPVFRLRPWKSPV